MLLAFNKKRSLSRTQSFASGLTDASAVSPMLTETLVAKETPSVSISHTAPAAELPMAASPSASLSPTWAARTPCSSQWQLFIRICANILRNEPRLMLRSKGQVSRAQELVDNILNKKVLEIDAFTVEDFLEALDKLPTNIIHLDAEDLAFLLNDKGDNALLCLIKQKCYDADETQQANAESIFLLLQICRLLYVQKENYLILQAEQDLQEQLSELEEQYARKKKNVISQIDRYSQKQLSGLRERHAQEKYSLISQEEYNLISQTDLDLQRQLSELEKQYAQKEKQLIWQIGQYSQKHLSALQEQHAHAQKKLEEQIRQRLQTQLDALNDDKLIFCAEKLLMLIQDNLRSDDEVLLHLSNQIKNVWHFTEINESYVEFQLKEMYQQGSMSHAKCLSAYDIDPITFRNLGVKAIRDNNEIFLAYLCQTTGLHLFKDMMDSLMIMAYGKPKMVAMLQQAKNNALNSSGELSSEPSSQPSKKRPSFKN